MATSNVGGSTSTHRKALVHSVSTICKEEGFDSASKLALETLTEMLQSYLTEIAECSREYCEQCHRTYPDVTDVKMALIDLGMKLENLDAYAHRPGRDSVKTPGISKPPSTPKPLQTSLTKQPRPPYVPVHLPPFPDVHSYVRTPTLRKPVNEYKIIREKIAAQKRDVESSLTGFMARTRPAETRIFHKMDKTKYPMIAPEELTVPYLRALVTEEECSEESDSQGDPSKNDDSKDKHENMKDVQDNPYVKPPKKAKLR